MTLFALGIQDSMKVLLKRQELQNQKLNSSTLLTFQFWIAGHNPTVIANAFVPVEPLTVDVINVGIGAYDLSKVQSTPNVY
jgi:hypothetical protein